MTEPTEVRTVKELQAGATRRFAIGASVLDVDDLRELHRRLEQKAQEAADQHIASLQEVSSHEEQIAAAREALKLVVVVQSRSGEYKGATSADVLWEEGALPADVASILFVSDPHNLRPKNWFRVTVDFGRPRILDLSLPADSPTPNNSEAVVAGDTTWTHGVHEEIKLFFQNRSARRNLLHGGGIYNLLTLVLGFPLSFVVVFHVSKRLGSMDAPLPVPLTVAISVYLVLIVLFFFRILFNYTKWLFPKIETPPRRTLGSVAHKTFWVGLAAATAYGAVWEFGKLLLGKLL